MWRVQECSEGDLDAMLAEQRPCHYAIANGHHVLWVPKHVPCSFEPSSGRLVVEVGHNSRCAHPVLVFPILRTSTIKRLRSRGI